MKIWSHYVALADLEFSFLNRLASNSKKSTYLWLQSAGFKGMYHHT